MKFVKDKLCLACEKGKQTKSSVKPKQYSSTTALFHLLPMDLFSPVPVESHAGKTYSLVIVDEFSRFTLVMFLCIKNDAIDEIISLIKHCEVLYDFKVKQLQSNHGTKFHNHTQKLL